MALGLVRPNRGWTVGGLVANGFVRSDRWAAAAGQAHCVRPHTPRPLMNEVFVTSEQAVTRRTLLESILATPFLAGLMGCGRIDKASAPQAAGGHAVDLAILDANVITADNARPRAQAIAIKNGRFVAVGSSEDIGAIANPDTLSSGQDDSARPD
jgi:hypothetical protein